MKTPLRSFFVLVFLTALTVTMFAQPTNTVPVPIPGATDAVPNVELSKLLLTVIVPGMVALMKTVVTKLPKPVIPVLAIALGAAADYAGSLLGVWQGSFVVGAVLGSAAIGVREVADQLKKWNAPPVT